MPRRKRSSRYSGYRRRGIRLDEEPSPVLTSAESFLRDDKYERAILRAVHSFDKAHVVMLSKQNIIKRRDARLLLLCLKKIEEEGVENVRKATNAYLHSGEFLAIRELGEEVGGKMHTGRSTGDLGAVGTRIPVREKLIELLREVGSLRGELLAKASSNTSTVMPGYSHLQQAQPTTLAHYLVSWVYALARDCRRLLASYRVTNQSPAGAAIFTGSDFPIDRFVTCELLGFDKIIENTRDAIFNNDFLLETASSVAMLAGDLGRMADDWLIWFSQEFGMIDIADRYCGTSSIMPQKKNPYALMAVSKLCGIALGKLATVFVLNKNPSDQFDLEANGPFEVLEGLDASIHATKLMAGVTSAISANRDLMLSRATNSWMQATDIASAITREKGVSWRSAHQIVGILVRRATEKGIPPSGVTAELLDEASREYRRAGLSLSERVLRNALDPVKCIEARKAVGGPAARDVGRQIQHCRNMLKSDSEVLTTIQKGLSEAESRLQGVCDAIIGA